MKAHRTPLSAAFFGVWAAFATLGCGAEGTPLEGVASFRVKITAVNGGPLPPANQPLPANRGDTDEVWDFELEARGPGGELEKGFSGLARLSVEPGTIVAVSQGAEPGTDRNVRFKGGKASGRVSLTAIYGPARLWAEDLGYKPAKDPRKAKCADGKNNDDGEDALVDHPNDPGCAFADDDSEEGGTHAAGVSLPVHYALPRVSDIQGFGTTTPYPFEGMEVRADDPHVLVVTRVASDGFYVTDLAEADKGYAHLFAFNFSTPAGMRVCDRVTYLAGTVVEFFGFTELSFPSFRVEPVFKGQACRVPDPVVLDDATIQGTNDRDAMEKLESALVRLENFRIAKKFGPKVAKNNVFSEDASNCDKNGDGQIDFLNDDEASCANACNADPECTEWTGFSARGNYKVSRGSLQIMINTGTVATFSPVAARGKDLLAVTGTMRNFSGGKLNWTVETRCVDDLVCAKELGCPRQEVVPTDQACVRLRTGSGNDEGTD